MKSWTRRLSLGLMIAIFIVAFIVLCVGDANGNPLTHDEALAKIQEWGPELTAEKIVALDTILQTEPVVFLPSVIIVVDTSGILHVAMTGPLAIDIAGYVHYDIAIGPWAVQDPTPAQGAWPYIIGGGIGLSVGLVIGFLIGLLL